MAITSPVLNEVATVTRHTFPQALNAVIGGKKIYKEEWGNPNFYGILKDGFLMLHKDDGNYYRWVLNDGDLLGIDWLILPEGN